LGIKADAIPGRLSIVRFSFEIPGYYSGQCSELCGAMHAFMPLVVMAVKLK
jgi:cytochrome c oxidase subunit 2